jgi:hypothetical protein
MLTYADVSETDGCSHSDAASAGEEADGAGGEEESSEEVEEEEANKWQGRDVYWWTLFSNSHLFAPKAELLEHVRRMRLDMGWGQVCEGVAVGGVGVCVGCVCVCVCV